MYYLVSSWVDSLLKSEMTLLFLTFFFYLFIVHEGQHLSFSLKLGKKKKFDGGAGY